MNAFTSFRCRILLIAALGVAVSATNAHGQLAEAVARGNASGSVRSQAGEPLRGAKIWALGTGRTATTGSDGEFILSDLNKGERYRLLVRARGFDPVVVVVSVTDTNALYGHEIVLKRFTGAGANPVVTIVGESRDNDRVFVDDEKGKIHRCGSTPTKCVSQPGNRRFRVEDLNTGKALCEWSVVVRGQDERCFVCVESTGKQKRCPRLKKSG